MKTKDEIIHILSQHKEELERLHVKSLSIFGSVARGENQSGSDIDFMVEFEGGSTLDKYVDLLDFLESVFQEDIDLVTKKGVRPELQERIYSESINVAG